MIDPDIAAKLRAHAKAQTQPEPDPEPEPTAEDVAAQDLIRARFVKGPEIYVSKKSTPTPNPEETTS